MVYFLRMKMRISTSQIQKPILAPVLQQSVGVLMLPITDLTWAIEQEVQSNPLLDVEEAPEVSPQQSEKYVHPIFRDWDQSLPAQTHFYDSNNDEIQEERPITKEETLEDYLLKQLRLEASNLTELKIGEFIISHINEDGYLTESCEKIAETLQISNHSLVEQVLSVIQGFDPIGIAARDLKECLMIQLKTKSIEQFSSVALSIIDHHLKNLAGKKYREIARKLKSPLPDVQKAAQVISSLEPKPARNYRPVQGNIYIKPDVIVHKDAEQKYHVHVNTTDIPKIRINPLYQQMLGKPNLSPEENTFILEKIKNASNFIKSIEQRGQTIREIAHCIVDKQKNFLEGSLLAIAPMTLKDVATLINRNESTVCRAVNNKYIDTPQGTFPMKFFFSQGLKDSAEQGGENISSRSIKENIKEMIFLENKSAPLSDLDIQRHLKEKGINVARRTISKYRQLLGILPYHLRNNKAR